MIDQPAHSDGALMGAERAPITRHVAAMARSRSISTSRAGNTSLAAPSCQPQRIVDNASVRLARSHVHTGFTERLRLDR